MSFSAIIGGWAVFCYVISIIFDSVGFGALALGLTIFALNNGGI